jgi:SsrA-binding protein
MAEKKKKQPTNSTIAQNRRAKFDYFIEDRVEAGLVLNGWEVKSLRSGKGQLTDSYVAFKNGEAWLMGCQIQPLPTASTHFVTEPMRMRKLLLNRREITRLQEAVEQKSYTVVATVLYWKAHMVKCEVALAKGKKQHDKRDTEKERDWDRQKQRIMSHPAPQPKS